MQTPTTDIVDQAIANQEAEDAKVVDDPKDPKGGTDDKDTTKKPDPAKDDNTGKPKPSGDPKDPKDEEPAKPKYDKDGKRVEAPKEDESELDKDGKPVEKKKDGKFTADDALETEVPEPPKTPTDNAGIQLSPAETAHIRDNIGEPIIIHGFTGEGDAQKPAEIKAYSANDIPANFKFANDQQMMAAQTGFATLERKAEQLLGSFRQNQSTTAAQDFEKRENEGIRGDVADLQKDGRFPKFTVRPGETGFDDSSEAQQMAEVLNVMTERNEAYLKQYNQGRPYKHIGFAEAFDIWEKQSPERQAAHKADDEQAAEDKARKAKAERGDSNRGMNPSNIMKPTVKAGTTTRDILNKIDNEDF